MLVCHSHFVTSSLSFASHILSQWTTHMTFLNLLTAIYNPIAIVWLIVVHISDVCMSNNIEHDFSFRYQHESFIKLYRDENECNNKDDWKHNDIFKLFTENMWSMIFNKIVLLPGGESNPGLSRDRRGYSPLYYRGAVMHTLVLLPFNMSVMSIWRVHVR